MREQLKKLTSDSAVYGISNIIGRFLNFLLVPFYTNFLPASAYGIVIVVYSYIAFFNILFTFGLDTAFMRYITDAEPSKKKDIFSTPFLFIFLAGCLYTIGLIALKVPVSAAMKIPVRWDIIVPISAATLLVDAMNVLPFASLRMENKAKRFALIKLASIMMNVALNVIFVAVLRKSIVAIFAAGLASSILSTILLFPTIAGNTVLRIRRPLLSGLLRFGIPTIPAGIAAMIVQVIDKPIMQHLADAQTVGIYGANYKLGIFMMLVVSMFQYAWQPFYLQTASAENARRLFARIMTYFLLFSMSLVLFLSLFIKDVVTFPLPGHRFLIHPDYWSGLGIVPIILFSYLWTGIGMILNAGLIIQKKTIYLPVVTGAGAIINIVCNFWWIPLYGIFGGAFATLAAYIAMTVLYWLITRKIYPVPYEYGRLLKIAIAGAVPTLAWYLYSVAFLPQVLWKAILFLCYIFLLVILGFFTQRERMEIGKLFAMIRVRKQQ